MCVCVRRSRVSSACVRVCVHRWCVLPTAILPNALLDVTPSAHFWIGKLARRCCPPSSYMFRLASLQNSATSARRRRMCTAHSHARISASAKWRRERRPVSSTRLGMSAGATRCASRAAASALLHFCGKHECPSRKYMISSAIHEVVYLEYPHGRSRLRGARPRGLWKTWPSTLSAPCTAVECMQKSILLKRRTSKSGA